MGEAIGQTAAVRGRRGGEPDADRRRRADARHAAARTNGPAFLLGWIAGIANLGAILLAVAGPARPATTAPRRMGDGSSSSSALAAPPRRARKWRGRPHEGDVAAAPKWMAALDALHAGQGGRAGGLLAARSTPRTCC